MNRTIETQPERKLTMTTALKVDENEDTSHIHGERDMLSQDITADIAVQSREMNQILDDLKSGFQVS